MRAAPLTRERTARFQKTRKAVFSPCLGTMFSELRAIQVYHVLKRSKEILMIKSWKGLLLAFLLALFAWYSVTGQERVETWVDVRIELRGLPPGMVVLAGLPSKLAVRVRGPQGLIRSLASSDLSYTLNLPNLTKGTHIVRISPDQLPFEGPFDVVEITPPMLTLEVENVVNKEVPLQYAFSAALPSDVKVESIRLEPDKVRLKGPETLFKYVKSVKAYIPVNDSFQPPEMQVQAMVQAPPGTEAEVKMVKAVIRLSLRTRTLSVERDVRVVSQLSAASQPGMRTKPQVVRLLLEVPASWDGGAPELEEVVATAVLPPDYAAGSELPVEVATPRNVKIRKITPAKVSIVNPQAGNRPEESKGKSG